MRMMESKSEMKRHTFLENDKDYFVPYHPLLCTHRMHAFDILISLIANSLVLHAVATSSRTLSHLLVRREITDDAEVAMAVEA